MPTQSPPDHYTTLGVTPSARHAEIRESYRRIMREVHPDVTGNDPSSAARAQEVNQAWTVLRDPVARAEYDRRRSEAHHPGGGSRSVGAEGRPAWGPSGPRPLTVDQLRDIARRQAAYSDIGRVNREAFSAASRRLGILVIAIGALVLALVG